MPSRTSFLSPDFQKQKADRASRRSAETEDDITRPMVLPVPRRLPRDSEPTLRLFLKVPERMQIDDEVELPRPEDGRR